MFEYKNYHQFFKTIFDIRMRYQKQDANEDGSERLECDHIKIFELVLIQNLFKIFGYIVNMIFICWLAGVIFYFLIVFVNKRNDR